MKRSGARLTTVHSQLTASITSNNPSDVANIVQAYIDEYRPEVNAISAAFTAQGAEGLGCGV